MRQFIARDEDGNLCSFGRNDETGWEKSIALKVENAVEFEGIYHAPDLWALIKQERLADIDRLKRLYDTLADAEGDAVAGIGKPI